MLEQAFKNVDDALWKKDGCPKAIMDEIAKLDAESAKVLGNIKSLL